MFGLYIVVSTFIGFLVGRWSHYWLNPKLGNPAWAPHHWIYGLLLLIGGVYVGGEWGHLVAAFGAGLFVSDIRDLFNGEFIGPDDMSKPLRFWGFD